MTWLSILGGAVIALVLWSFISLINNYNAARKVGLPIVVTPINPENPFMAIYGRHLMRSWTHVLPRPFKTWIQFGSFGWTFDDKTDMHDKLGPVFINVNPGANGVWIADPDVWIDIVTRRKDFLQPEFTKCRVYQAELLSLL